MSCTSTCLETWIALIDLPKTLPSALSADDFELFRRSDGWQQVAYKGWPLYTNINDENVRDSNEVDDFILLDTASVAP